MKLNNINNILFVTLSNIGDVVLTLPILSALKDNFPNREIDIVVGPKPKEVFAKDPGIKNIFIYNKHANLKEKLDFIKKLRNRKYDLCVDMRGSLIPILIGAKNRSRLISINNKIAVKHKKLLHLNKLKGLGIEYKERKNIYIDKESAERINTLLKKSGVKKNDLLIGVSPSCRSHLKEWRIDGFIEVVNDLLKDSNCKVILIGDDTQLDIAGEIRESVRYEGLIDLTGKINLNELFSLIEKMNVLLTCDSASMHIACEVGTKVVAIFGPTDPEEYGPTGKNDMFIRKKIECSPCKKARCFFNHKCMQEIDAKEVLKAVRKVLSYK